MRLFFDTGNSGGICVCLFFDTGNSQEARRETTAKVDPSEICASAMG